MDADRELGERSRAEVDRLAAIIQRELDAGLRGERFVEPVSPTVYIMVVVLLLALGLLLAGLWAL